MKEIDYYNLMKGFEAEEIEPMVGIFWYLPEEHRLFEVYASALSQSKMVNGHTTYSKLHKTIWQAKKCRDRAKGKETSVYYQDYTRIPRGRIFYDNGKFIVKVGSWYKQYEDELRELVANELIAKNSDVIIAFPSESSKGTYDTIRKAKKFNKIVRVCLLK